MLRVSVLGLLLLGAVLVTAACGEGVNPTPTNTPLPAPPSIPTSIPTSPVTPTATPTHGPVSTATPTEISQADSEGKYSWDISIVDEEGAKPSLAVNPDGTPHIAYIYEALPGYVNYAIPGSDGWEITEVSAGYFYGPLDIQLDGQGAPHIAWHNHDTEDEAYAVLNGGAWTVHNVDHDGHDGWDNSLALDSNALPHTASIDPSQFGGTSGVEYARFDGDDWHVEEVGSGPIPYEFGTDIVMDSQDQPHVVWYDDNPPSLRYAVKDDDEWLISDVDNEGDVGRFPSLVLNEMGGLAVTYYEVDTPTTGYIKYAIWDGTQWVSQRVDRIEQVVLGHFGARRNSSLVLDNEGNPIIAYSDEAVVKLAWWDGSKWNLETVFTGGESPLGQQVSLGLDSSGCVHLTFVDKTRLTSHGVKGAVMYARGSPTN